MSSELKEWLEGLKEGDTVVVQSIYDDPQFTIHKVTKVLKKIIRVGCLEFTKKEGYEYLPPFCGKRTFDFAILPLTPELDYQIKFDKLKAKVVSKVDNCTDLELLNKIANILGAKVDS